MKVQKINNNKAMIVLTPEELALRKITIKDIKEGKDKAKNFFFEILEDSEICEDFGLESSQLLIEVVQTTDNLFTITVTKADCIPDTNFMSKMKSIKNVSYTVSSNIYEFENLKNLYLFSIRALKEELFVGTNSLYLLNNNNYYICFSNSTIKSPCFVKTFSVLSEYTSKYYSKKTSLFSEYASLLMKNTAIQCLQKM